MQTSPDTRELLPVLADTEGPKTKHLTVLHAAACSTHGPGYCSTRHKHIKPCGRGHGQAQGLVHDCRWAANNQV
jgi:hypothetical protein